MGGWKPLKDISLTIPDGDVYGIIGMSGAGKSTLVRCINMLERPTSGEVIVNGKRLIPCRPRSFVCCAARHYHDLPALQSAHAAELPG